jgi:broad specificity phosphatase PhoE
MSGATIFHLIRHGAHELLDHVLAGRMEGVGLSESGRAEAATIAQSLAARPIVAVVSSPVQRARETAAPIAARLGREVEIEPGFEEIDFGDWTGLGFDVLHAMPAWHAFNSFRGFAPVPGGESMAAAQARALAAIGRLRARYHDGEVAVISHSDVIKAVLAHFLGVPLDLFRRIEVSPASRSVLAVFDSDALVRGVNLPPGV